MWTCANCGYNTADNANQFCGRCGKARDDAGASATAFDVYLLTFNPAWKINVIKVVRELTHYSLKEAKDLVEHAPQPLAVNLPRETAEAMLAKLQAGGAQGELTPHGAPPSMPVTPITLSPPGTSTGCTGVLLAMVGLLCGLAIVWWMR